MGQSMRARRSILLAAALAALLLVIGVSASAVWWSARNSQERVAALQAAHMRAGVALAAIRANVYLNAILTRDYLLDPDSSHAVQYIDQFKSIQANTEESFRTLETLGLDNEQKGALNQLHKELTAYWDPTEVVLDWSPEEKRAQRTDMLRQRVRRRQEIFALAEQVERLVTANFTRERQRITTADREFRISLGWTTGIALLLGFAIAGGTLARMLGAGAPVTDGGIATPPSVGPNPHRARARTQVSVAGATRSSGPDAHRTSHGTGEHRSNPRRLRKRNLFANLQGKGHGRADAANCSEHRHVVETIDAGRSGIGPCSRLAAQGSRRDRPVSKLTPISSRQRTLCLIPTGLAYIESFKRR